MQNALRREEARLVAAKREADRERTAITSSIVDGLRVFPGGTNLQLAEHLAACIISDLRAGAENTPSPPAREEGPRDA